MFQNNQKLISVLQEETQSHGIVLTEEMFRKISVYCDILWEVNQHVNLTRIVEPQEVAIKHVLDSLLIHDTAVFKPGGHVVDIGSGAGFPGVPLAILREDLSVTLVDSLRKRTDFLQHAVKAANITNIDVVHARAEDFGRVSKYRQRFDAVTARAVAPLNILTELCLPVLRIGGYFVVMKGPEIDEELSQARTAIRMTGGILRKSFTYSLPRGSDGRTLIHIQKVAPTPAQFPRKAGTPQKQPL